MNAMKLLTINNQKSAWQIIKVSSFVAGILGILDIISGIIGSIIMIINGPEFYTVLIPLWLITLKGVITLLLAIWLYKSKNKIIALILLLLLWYPIITTIVISIATIWNQINIFGLIPTIIATYLSVRALEATIKIEKNNWKKTK